MLLATIRSSERRRKKGVDLRIFVVIRCVRGGVDDDAVHDISSRSMSKELSPDVEGSFVRGRRGSPFETPSGTRGHVNSPHFSRILGRYRALVGTDVGRWSIRSPVSPPTARRMHSPRSARLSAAWWPHACLTATSSTRSCRKRSPACSARVAVLTTVPCCPTRSWLHAI